MNELDAFFQHYIVCKLYHFQTASGFRHTKIDLYTAKFLLNFDNFMEVLQGNFGTIDTKQVKIDAVAKNDINIMQHFDDMIAFLTNLKVNNNNLSPDLATIRDQMVADLQQLKYLFTFE